MGVVTLQGLEVGYDDEGDGHPLVLVHGHPFDRSMWRPQIDALSRTGWRVIAPDLRGYGETAVRAGTTVVSGITGTSGISGITTLDAFARDIARLLDHLGIARAVLAGVSMGGQIAMELHRLFPGRTRGLVLMDTSPRAETADGRDQRRRLADRLEREGMDGYADEVLPKMVTPATIATRPEVARHVLAMMRATSPAGAAAALRGRAERPDYVDMLGHVTVPTLVVVGRYDQLTPVDEARLMHERIPDSTLVVVDGAAHLPNLERPAELNAALQQFLYTVDTVDTVDSVDAVDAVDAASRATRGTPP